VKAGPDLEQAGDAAAEVNPAGRWLGDPAEDLQERRLAGPVPADQAESLTVAKLEGDVAESPGGG